MEECYVIQEKKQATKPNKKKREKKRGRKKAKPVEKWPLYFINPATFITAFLSHQTLHCKFIFKAWSPSPQEAAWCQAAALHSGAAQDLEDPAFQ